MEYHVPVMLKECLEGLKIRPDGVYVDVTFGGGGHSRAILEQLGPKGHLYSFDQDPDAEKNILSNSSNSSNSSNPSNFPLADSPAEAGSSGGR